LINIYNLAETGKDATGDIDIGGGGRHQGGSTMETAAVAGPEGQVALTIPSGLDGVVVADTEVGDVRGLEGFYHYRQYSAVELARSRPFEDVWHLLIHGELPDAETGDAFAQRAASLRDLPSGTADIVRRTATSGDPTAALRSAVSVLGAALGWGPTHDLDQTALRSQAIRLCAVAPTAVAAVSRLRRGLEPVPARTDLGHVANYLWMLQGEEPDPKMVRSLEQYLISTIDHGFNASTFVARVIASTGSDLASAVGGAIGALAGPLHGGAPGRALEMLDEVRAEGGDPAAFVRRATARGERIMGFGHRLYKTVDPRAVLLREVVGQLDEARAKEALEVERKVADELGRRKPGRRLYANVEFYAGVVMEACGIPPELFTPTFATSRMVGWSAHLLEQVAHNRLIRPSARYVGPPPPQPVPVR
jgi:citrate synthase